MNIIKRYIAIGVLAVSSGTLASCSVWDFVKPSSGLSVDTELVVGDKNQTANVSLGETTNKADSIIQNIDNVDKTTLGLLILSVATGVVGWMSPVPGFIRRRKKP